MIKYVATLNNMEWTLDPTGKHLVPESKMTPEILVEFVGILPSFINEDAENTSDLISTARERYRMPTHEMKGGAMDGRGVYSYEGDPDLHPIMSTMVGSVENASIVHIYMHGMIAFVDINTGEHHMYRMD